MGRTFKLDRRCVAGGACWKLLCACKHGKTSLHCGNCTSNLGALQKETCLSPCSMALEAIAIRLEAIAIRLEAITIRLEAIATIGWRPLLQDPEELTTLCSTSHVEQQRLFDAGILYENAMDLWNDTMQSYLDDHIYPPSQSVIVRCEDFLFSYAKALRPCQVPNHFRFGGTENPWNRLTYSDTRRQKLGPLPFRSFVGELPKRSNTRCTENSPID